MFTPYNSIHHKKENLSRNVSWGICIMLLDNDLDKCCCSSHPPLFSFSLSLRDDFFFLHGNPVKKKIGSSCQAVNFAGTSRKQHSGMKHSRLMASISVSSDSSLFKQQQCKSFWAPFQTRVFQHGPNEDTVHLLLDPVFFTELKKKRKKKNPFSDCICVIQYSLLLNRWNINNNKSPQTDVNKMLVHHVIYYIQARVGSLSLFMLFYFALECV